MKSLVRHARDLKHIVIAPDDPLRAHGPETDTREQKHQGIVNHNPYDTEDQKAQYLKRCRHEVHLVRGIDHHAHRRDRIHECTQVHLPEGHHKSRIYRQQQQEIHFAGPHELGQIGAIDQKESLEKLLNEMTGTNQHHHLPFGPRSDVVRMEIKHADETKLKGEPEGFHHNPHQKVRYENHLASHRVLPQCRIDAEIPGDARPATIPDPRSARRSRDLDCGRQPWRAALWIMGFGLRISDFGFPHYPPTAEYFLMPLSHINRAIP